MKEWTCLLTCFVGGLTALWLVLRVVRRSLPFDVEPL